MTRPYTIFVHLADSSGRPVAQIDAQPRAGAFPTTWWAPGETVSDPVKVSVPSSTPLGDYQVLVGAYDVATLQRLPVSGGGDSYRIGTVIVSAA
jgi:hypothetical protein